MGVLTPLTGTVASIAFAGTSVWRAARPKWGYMFAFPLCTWLTARLCEPTAPATAAALLRCCVGAAAAQASVVAVGAGWLVMGCGVQWSTALSSGLLPFLPGLLMKSV